jgi:hypothetical protein
MKKDLAMWIHIIPSRPIYRDIRIVLTHLLDEIVPFVCLL